MLDARHLIRIFVAATIVGSAVVTAPTSTAQVDTTGPELSGVSISPTEVDVSTSSQQVTVTVEGTDSSGISYGWVNLSPSSFTCCAVGTNLDTTAMPDPTAGEVSAVMTVPALAPGGPWFLDIFLTDSAGNSSFYDQVELWTAGFDHRLDVTSLPNFTGPDVHTLSLAETSVDVSDSAAEVTVVMSITDDGPGFDHGFVTWRSPSRPDQRQTAGFNVSFPSGPDTYTGTLWIPRYAEAGSWTVESIDAWDTAGAHTHLDARDIEVLGLREDLSVAANPSDTTDPVVSSVDVVGDRIVYSHPSATQTVEVDLGITDDLSSPGGVQMAWGTGTGSLEFASAWLPGHRVGDSDVYRVPVNVPAASSPGTWRLRWLMVSDQAGNDVFISRSWRLNGLGVRRFDVYPGDCTVKIHEGQAPSEDADVICGTPGADVVAGLGGGDVLYGGDGDDSLSGDGASDQVFGGLGNDSVSGDDGSDVVRGGTGSNVVTGGGGDDTLGAGAKNDDLMGGDGPDTIRGGKGHDRIWGGEDGTVDGTSDSNDDLILAGSGGDDVDAGTGADVVQGGGGRDFIVGGSGNDEILSAAWGFGQEGDDSLISDRGEVTLFGGPGNDELRFTSPYLWSVKLVGNDGSDFLWGGNGDDVLFGGNTSGPDDDNAENHDTIHARDGDDYLSGGIGQDNLRGQRGRDVIQGGDDADDVLGGRGPDRVLGEAGDDRVRGGRKQDVVVGHDGADWVQGGSGADTVAGGHLSGPDDAGIDSVLGGAGDDYVSGGAGSDELFGKRGNDALQGGTGSDVVHGDDGNDVLMGDAGDDSLSGDAGNDTIDEGSAPNGADAIEGGPDIDAVDYSLRTMAVSVTKDSTSNDGASGESDNIAGDIENALLPVIAPPVQGGGGGVTPTPTPTPSPTVSATPSPTPTPPVPDGVPSDGDVTIESSGGTLVIPAGTGVVTVVGDGNLINLEGTRSVVIIGSGNEIVGSADADMVEIIGDDNVVELGAGDDQLSILDLSTRFAVSSPVSANVVEGGPGHDTLRSASAADELAGNGGDDVLTGGGGRDLLSGGAGDDALSGGRGGDLLDGGRHADVLRGGRGIDSYYATKIDDVQGCETRLRRAPE